MPLKDVIQGLEDIIKEYGQDINVKEIYIGPKNQSSFPRIQATVINQDGWQKIVTLPVRFSKL